MNRYWKHEEENAVLVSVLDRDCFVWLKTQKKPYNFEITHCHWETMPKKRPIDPIHPETTLEDKFDQLQLTPAAFARDLGVPPNKKYSIIAGERAIPADTAFWVQKWLGISADFWMKLQETCRLDRAKELHSSENRKAVRSAKHMRDNLPRPVKRP